MEKPPEKQEEDNVIRSLDDPRVQQMIENIDNGVLYRIVSTKETTFVPTIIELSGSDGLGFFEDFDLDEKEE